MKGISGFFTLAMFLQLVRSTAPYLCASLGGVWSERSGVVNIALEAKLLVAAFVSVAVHLATASAWLGLLAGIAAGACVGVVHGFLVEYARVNAIISGLALNVFAVAITRVGLRTLYASSSNSPSIEAFGRHTSSGWAVWIEPHTVLPFAALVLTILAFQHTPFGLRVRAVGEGPVEARALGVNVTRTRISATAIGGAVAGLGGVALAYDLHQFQAGMSAGRGFVALAIVVISGWRPAVVLLVTFVFSFLDTLQIAMQGSPSLAGYTVQALPYVITLLALSIALSRGRVRAPRGLDQPAERTP